MKYGPVAGIVWWTMTVIVAFIVTVWDLRERRIPDMVVFPALAAFVCYWIVVDINAILFQTVSACVGFAVFLAIRLGSGGSLGWGDVKLSGLMGLSLGLPGWVIAVLAASFAGLTVMLVLMRLSRADRNTKVPFGPFLALGMVAAALALPHVERFLYVM
jgi:prepilin signal peptidase PulO-like enzyme (type II secretory pathway)